MFKRLFSSQLISWEGNIGRMRFLRSYFPLLFAAIVFQTIAAWTLSSLLSWLVSSIAIFLAIVIVFLVIKRLRDTGHRGRTALLFFIPFANLWAAYLVFFKKGNISSEHPIQQRKPPSKALILLLLFSISASTWGPLITRPVYAADEPLAGIGEWFNGVGKGIGDFTGGVVDTVGKGIDQIKAIAKIDVPGIGVIDLTEFRGVESILDKLPSDIEVPIPFTSFTIKYDRKKSPGENIVSNIAPFLSGVVGTLDPMKPAASLARGLLSLAKPYFDQWVKPYIPAAIKNGANSVLEFIKPLLHAVEDPIIKTFLMPVWEFIAGPIDDLALDIIKLLAEEATTGVPLFSNPVTGDPGQMIFSGPPQNQHPVGILETIDDYGVVTGWAADPDDPTRSLTVQMYLTGTVYKGENDFKAEIGKPVLANLSRPDITASRGFGGNHGFTFVIPAEYRVGGAMYHSIAVYADDTNGKVEDRTRLEGSPKEFKIGLPLAGALESVNSSGKVTGWAFNPNYRSLYHYDLPRVELYADGAHDKGGSYITSEQPYRTRNDINLKDVDVMGGSHNQIGFESNLDESRFRDGKQHELYAYVVAPSSLQENKILLPGSPMPFRMSVIHKISFKYYYQNIAHGLILDQVVEKVPNKEHRMDVLLDDKVLDMNELLHSYPVHLPEDVTYLTVHAEGQGQTRSVPIHIHIPRDTSLGDHRVRVRTHDEDAGVIYDETFPITVTAYELMLLHTPDELMANTNVEFTLDRIPPGAIFSGTGANVILQKLTLGGELGAVSLQNYTISGESNGSAKISFAVPYEASSIRNGKGPVSVNMEVVMKRGGSDDLKQAMQFYGDNFRSYEGLTKTGGNPVLIPFCKSSLTPEISFVARTATGEWRAITAEKPYELGSGDLVVEGKEFSCFESLSIEMAARDGEKQLNIIPIKVATVTVDGTTYPTGYMTDEHAYFNFRVFDANWEGVFTEEKGIQVVPLDVWNVEHGTVEELLVTVKDASGHHASAKLPLFTKYTLKVVPGEGTDVLKPSGPMRIWWKGFTYGNKVRMSIDGESLRNVLLEKGKLETFEGRALNYIDELSVPSWITPGSHKLTFEDITELDAKGKSKYRAEVTFTIPGGKVTLPSNNDTKKEPDAGQAKVAALEQQVKLSVSTAKAGTSITATVTGFAPLGTVTIMLTQPENASIKLSGFADYTDSNGALNKQVKIPEETKAGTYMIVVQDTLGQTAESELTIEAASAQNVVVPGTSPSALPTPVVENTNTPPSNNPGATPSCPSGSTYSFTFQRCIEEKPDKLSPYDGLPCPPAGSVPNYTTYGCIP